MVAALLAVDSILSLLLGLRGVSGAGTEDGNKLQDFLLAAPYAQKHLAIVVPAKLDKLIC